MPTTKRQISLKKQELLSDLRAMHARGASLPGSMAISQRELSAKYGLSLRTVALEMQKLVAEGVLYTIPRVGTFVGRPPAQGEDYFVALFRYSTHQHIHFSAVRAGFEERIARLGGRCLVFDFETAKQLQMQIGVTSPVGIFEFHDIDTPTIWPAPTVPHVEFGKADPQYPNSDTVDFDNVSGGRAATGHLIAQGHRKIAFLGLNTKEDASDFLLWSRDREIGWKQAMKEANLDTEGLDFLLPQAANDYDAQLFIAARENAKRLLKQHEITAVVAVNNLATKALIEILRETKLSTSSWPALVAFDNELHLDDDPAMSLVSSFRLPWEEIGSEAANLLWKRSKGEISDSPQRTLVRMSLIPRLSCRREWQQAHEKMIPISQTAIASR